MAFYEQYGANTADSGAQTITADIRVADPFDPANLTLTQLAASTSEEWAGFYVNVHQVNNLARGILVVCTGAASSEVSIATLPTRPHTRNNAGWSIYVPVSVSASTRISVGASCGATSDVEVQIVGVPSSNFTATPSFAKMESGPYDLQNSSGTYGRPPEFDPGGTANTKGSYSEISESDTNGTNNEINGDSIAQAYDYMGFAFADNVNSAQTNQAKLWDIAYGAASSETIFIDDFYTYTGGNESSNPLQPIWLPWGRASGDRISARMQNSLIDATDRIGSIVMFGLR